MLLATDYSQLSDMVVVLVTTLYTVSKVLDWGTKVRVGMICSRVSSVIPGTLVRHVLGDHWQIRGQIRRSLANQRPE